jgi:hypothetical protein
MRRKIFVAVWAALLSAMPFQPAGAADVPKSIADFGPEGVWSTSCDVDRMTDSKTCRMLSSRPSSNRR